MKDLIVIFQSLNDFTFNY